MNDMKDKYTPEWAERFNRLPHRPDWQDKIPHLLWELGDVFFPIPRGVKGWSWPHGNDDYRYAPDSKILNAYFAEGWGYGIACAGDLAVVDIDEPEYIGDITSRLPPTANQVSGSGEGVHLFYHCPGLNTRRTLFAKNDGEKIHVGEIKCDPHGYVVGPGSVHPSGNKYGPLKGEEIVEIGKDRLLELLDDYFVDEDDQNNTSLSDYVDRKVIQTKTHPFYELTADDVLPWLEPNNRIAHPVHGSDQTGANFMKNEDGDTFTCWRCQYGTGPGCGINAQQFLALRAVGENLGSHACETLRRRWGDSRYHYYAWRRAVDDGFVSRSQPPFKVIEGYAADEGIIDPSDDLGGDTYWDAYEALQYELDSERMV